MCVYVAKPVAVELRCHATALIRQIVQRSLIKVCAVCNPVCIFFMGYFNNGKPGVIARSVVCWLCKQLSRDQPSRLAHSFVEKNPLPLIEEVTGERKGA